jgi:pyrrolidone-carboxylate peptidase
LSRSTLLLSVGLVLLGTPALAGPELSGRWKDGGKAYFTLRHQSDGTYAGTVRSPRDLTRHGLRLIHNVEQAWTLEVTRQRPTTLGIAGRIEGREPVRVVRELPFTVALVEETKFRLSIGHHHRKKKRRIRSRKLKSADKAWEIKLPLNFSHDAAEEEDADPEAAAQPVEPIVPVKRPVVRVLITGFDRFPRPRNHPRWVSDGNWDGEWEAKEPRINPSGWAVRQFSVDDLDPKFRETVQIELHKCLDVPVTYEDGAKLITDTAARVDADIVISFGVGSNGNSDADVEQTCENLMDDADDPQRDDNLGPFQLSPDWPPEGRRSDWPAADRVWLLRYPDNAGVSYNGAKISLTGPDTLGSLLPVDRIVRRIKMARDPRLSAIDGGWGPGRYICNNVMYRVIETQAARGKLGGFVHLAQWDEDKREKYLRVVALAVEESALKVVEDDLAAADPGLPEETPVAVALDDEEN